MSHRTTDQLTLVLALKVFLLDGQARNLSEKTLRTYEQQLTWFIDYVDSLVITHIGDVRPDHLNGYLVNLQTRGWAPASQHVAFRTLRTFFRYCQFDGLLVENPMERVRAPKIPEKELPAFTEEEVKKVLAGASTQRDRAIVLCLLDTGCRANELLAWNIGDVNAQTGVVKLHKTKGRKERVVYLGITARKELLKLYAFDFDDLEPTAPVWRSHNTGERLTYYGLAIMLRKLGTSTNIRPCNPHRFRRTFALWSLRNGMNIYALQRLMGHSDITILRRYLALVETDLRTAHERFGAVDNAFR